MTEHLRPNRREALSLVTGRTCMFLACFYLHYPNMAPTKWALLSLLHRIEAWGQNIPLLMTAHDRRWYSQKVELENVRLSTVTQ